MFVLKTCYSDNNAVDIFWQYNNMNQKRKDDFDTILKLFARKWKFPWMWTFYQNHTSLLFSCLKVLFLGISFVFNDFTIRTFHSYTFGEQVFQVDTRYRNLKVIGSGSYGIVCSADDTVFLNSSFLMILGYRKSSCD